MAGGGGTRLWPLSRGDSPKQFLPLVEDDSMFRVSITRLSPLFTPEHIYVVAGKRYLEKLKQEAPEIPTGNFILEPSARDSGPAAALGVSVIHQRDPQATVAILTADHHIADKPGFRNALAAAYDVAQQGHIVTLGITPSLPATGFGYIRRGESLIQARGLQAFHSLGFTEKPDLDTAKRFLLSGEYAWNSGMFIWRAERALTEYARQQPDTYAHMQAVAAAVDTDTYETVLQEHWEGFEKKSIDYAVMEHAERMVVIPVDIGWSDVGSWSALYEVLALDATGSFAKSGIVDWLNIDTQNTLIFSHKLVATVGVQGLVVVDTDDALLICDRERAQDVKLLVERLKAAGNRQNYL
jgi:mannose-1-phosphate guanylyltransferase